MYVVKMWSQKFDLCMWFITLLNIFVRAVARLSWRGLRLRLHQNEIRHLLSFLSYFISTNNLDQLSCEKMSI